MASDPRSKPPTVSDGKGPAGLEQNSTLTLRVAAAGDVHCRASGRDEIDAAVRQLSGKVDLLLLAGDLTMHGEPEEALVLADACRALEIPKFAVLGNHDWHGGHQEEIARILVEGGITPLERSWSICEIGGTEVGIVGTKGFVGGFPGSHLPDFGEPLLRQVYREASAEVESLDAGLREVAVCPVRIVLLHYSPTETTLHGEAPGIWAFLGTDRMAPPIAEHGPDFVLHGHAHAGQPEGSIGDVPVFNVSVPVLGRDFWMFELSGVHKTLTPIH
jgi:Icc-related predicted phosphoesterase